MLQIIWIIQKRQFAAKSVMTVFLQMIRIIQSSQPFAKTPVLYKDVANDLDKLVCYKVDSPWCFLQIIQIIPSGHPLLQRKQSGKVARTNLFFLLFSSQGKQCFCMCVQVRVVVMQWLPSLSAAAAAAGCFSNTNRGSLIHRNLRSHVKSCR